jgi:hypothetical protein
MEHITQAMERLNVAEDARAEDMSIVQKIIQKTSNPKIAAVLALDLLLVGVDTVSTTCQDSAQNVLIMVQSCLRNALSQTVGFLRMRHSHSHMSSGNCVTVIS